MEEDEIRTPFITAVLAERDRRAADRSKVGPWPGYLLQPDMLPPLTPPVRQDP